MVMRFDMAAPKPSFSDETRTYTCQRCGTENELTKTVYEWAVLDQE
jgi:hypothetical protein